MLLPLGSLTNSCKVDSLKVLHFEMGHLPSDHLSEMFQIPRSVDTVGIKASFQDGMIRIALPKIVKAQSKTPAMGRKIHGGGLFSVPESGSHSLIPIS